MPRDADLLDIAPTVLHLLGVPVPDDMDGRVLSELLDPSFTPVDVPVPDSILTAAHTAASNPTTEAVYTAEEDAEIQRRLEELGYL